jgi:hypothetical protein
MAAPLPKVAKTMSVVCWAPSPISREQGQDLHGGMSPSANT